MTVGILVNKWHSKHVISLHEKTSCSYIVRLLEKAGSVAPGDPQLFLGRFPFADKIHACNTRTTPKMDEFRRM